ncbi:hypothetical protein [uncultured Selenomonas sp.]|uniref:hypothetical protein n=1 Tax=uncultured Selenomonas sp. TaxID=159275 RepID=UPI0026160D71|nr:hypothetical protein [uncultured Selenomonas sp.]
MRRIEKKKMGRPTTNPRTGQINVRLSERELALLNECAERMGTTRTDVIARGIETVHRELEEAE